MGDFSSSQNPWGQYNPFATSGDTSSPSSNSNSTRSSPNKINIFQNVPGIFGLSNNQQTSLFPVGNSSLSAPPNASRLPTATVTGPLLTKTIECSNASTGNNIPLVNPFKLVKEDLSETSGSLKRRVFAVGTQSPEPKQKVQAVDVQTDKQRPISISAARDESSAGGTHGILLKNIPEKFNSKIFLQKHFQRYGKIKRITPQLGYDPKSASVFFTDKDSANKALANQQSLGPSVKFYPRKAVRLSDSSASKTTKPLAPPAIAARAMSDADKLAVLEARDKEIRQALKESTGSGAILGTCPDMCPEVERLRREVRRRVSVYESDRRISAVFPAIDHDRAVKEYDRSAADKDEPLPHELRPTPVLRMTMDFLLTEILDSERQPSSGEWFDFLWNRTRAIRKDIIQQRLCDTETVDLVEKCVRFHIYCAHALCEAPPSAFDQKINTENLTKSLETLKQFYEDLDAIGVVCRCEAEFRSYQVLLNLNKGDIQWEIQHFKTPIRKSPEVTLAIRLLTAVQTNNYVGFFKILRCASYLQRCLLHRYLTQIRWRGLRCLNRAHRSGRYPIARIGSLLGFESESELVEFAAHYGVAANADVFEFTKEGVNETVDNPPDRFCPRLIESVRSGSVGEIVNNGPLPTPPAYKATSSFSIDGDYLGDPKLLPSPTVATATTTSTATSVSGVDDNIPVTLETNPEMVHYAPAADEPVVRTETVVSNLDDKMHKTMKGCLREMFLEVIDDEVLGIIGEVDDWLKHLEESTRLCAEDLTEEATLLVVLEVSREVMEEEEKEREALLEIQELIERITADVINDINDEVTLEYINLEIANEIRSFRYDRCVISETVEVVDEVVEDMMVDVVDEVYQSDVVQRLRLLSSLAVELERDRMRRCYTRWRSLYVWASERRNAMYNFPACVPIGRPSALPTNRRSLGSGDTETETSRLFVQSKAASLFRAAHRYKPIALESLISVSPIGGSPQHKLGIKLAVLYSEKDELSHWLACKLGGNPNEPINSGLLNRNISSIPIGSGGILTLGVATVAVPLPNEDFRAAMKGCACVVATATSSTMSGLCEASDWLRDTPVLLVLPSSSSPGDPEGLAALETRLDSMRFLHLDETLSGPAATVELTEGLRWLLDNAKSPPRLVCGWLRDLVETTVAREFGRRVSEIPLVKLPQLVDLYNESIRFLTDRLDSSRGLPWPPPEMAEHNERLGFPPEGWNSPEELGILRDKLARLRLPHAVAGPIRRAARKLVASLPGQPWEKIPLRRGVDAALLGDHLVDLPSEQGHLAVSLCIEYLLNFYRDSLRTKVWLTDIQVAMETPAWWTFPRYPTEQAPPVIQTPQPIVTEDNSQSEGVVVLPLTPPSEVVPQVENPLISEFKSKLNRELEESEQLTRRLEALKQSGYSSLSADGVMESLGWQSLSNQVRGSACDVIITEIVDDEGEVLERVDDSVEDKLLNLRSTVDMERVLVGLQDARLNSLYCMGRLPLPPQQSDYWKTFHQQ